MKKSMWWGLALLAVVGMGVLGGCKKEEDKTNKKDTEQTEKEGVPESSTDPLAVPSAWKTTKIGLPNKPGKEVGMKADDAETTKLLVELIAPMLKLAGEKTAKGVEKYMPALVNAIKGVEFQFEEGKKFTASGIRGLKNGTTPSGTWREEEEKVYIKFENFEIDDTKTGKERHLAEMLKGAFRATKGEEVELTKRKDNTMLYVLSGKQGIETLNTYVNGVTSEEKETIQGLSDLVGGLANVFVSDKIGAVSVVVEKK